jgi:methionyl-tRNA synthetase
MNSKKFYITTPIYYINAEPSIGSACTTVAADVVARLHRQLGEEVFSLTGTDEHGEKVAESAQNAGLSPIEFCNQIAPKFEEAWKLLNISNDFFIRTTDPRHEKVVGEVLQKIYDEGDIYKDKYEGWYCTGCEAFKTEKELVDGHCPLHPPEKTVKKSEENWFFKLSKYIPKIIELIENPETNYIFPESKRLEILAKLKARVNDVSISREKVKWGIPVPWDTEHTIYVWIDALINYYSATQFLENKSEFWPADLHLLGKEILWFHTVIWQAMLMSANLPLPKKTYIHDFYTIDGQKMSKSLGNTIPPKEMVDLFGTDGARYLIARSFPNNGDVDVGMARFKEKYNADLANNLGNLVSRVCKLGEGIKVSNLPKSLFDKRDFQELINNLKFDEAIGWVFENYIDKSNNRLNEVTPWKLEANDPKRIEVLTECAQNLKNAAFYLTPVMPEISAKILTQLDGEIKTLETGLFPRIK